MSSSRHIWLQINRAATNTGIPFFLSVYEMAIVSLCHWERNLMTENVVVKAYLAPDKQGCHQYRYTNLFIGLRDDYCLLMPLRAEPTDPQCRCQYIKRPYIHKYTYILIINIGKVEMAIVSLCHWERNLMIDNVVVNFNWSFLALSYWLWLLLVGTKSNLLWQSSLQYNLVPWLNGGIGDFRMQHPKYLFSKTGKCVPSFWRLGSKRSNRLRWGSNFNKREPGKKTDRRDWGNQTLGGEGKKGKRRGKKGKEGGREDEKRQGVIPIKVFVVRFPGTRLCHI